MDSHSEKLAKALTEAKKRFFKHSKREIQLLERGDNQYSEEIAFLSEINQNFRELTEAYVELCDQLDKHKKLSAEYYSKFH